MSIRPVRRAGLAALAVVMTAGLSGCHTDLEVLVRAKADGSGTVRVTASLDDDATQAVGQKATAVASNDLEQAGWAVSGVRLGTSGGATISAERSFANTSQGNAVLAQLSGPKGPLPSLTLHRRRTVLATTVSVQGTADLRPGLAVFGDDALRDLIGSSSLLGLDDAEVARQAGRSVRSALRFRVVTQLAGSTKTWVVPVGSETRIDASARRWAWATAASLAALLVGLVGLAWLLHGRSGAVAGGRPGDVPGAPSGPSPARPAGDTQIPDDIGDHGAAGVPPDDVDPDDVDPVENDAGGPGRPGGHGDGGLARPRTGAAQD